MRSSYAIVLISGLAILSSGCSVAWNALNTTVVEPARYPTCLEDVLLKVRACRLAEDAWKKVQDGRDYPKDYRKGFREGFVDYLRFGGNGEPPPVPPRQYWSQDSPGGRQAAQDWFAGFRHGAAMAHSSGNRELIVIPVSATLAVDHLQPGGVFGSNSIFPSTPPALLTDPRVLEPSPPVVPTVPAAQLPLSNQPARLGPPVVVNDPAGEARSRAAEPPRSPTSTPFAANATMPAWTSTDLVEEPCPCRPELWVRTEGLLWWLRSHALSTPVVTASTVPDVIDANGNNVSAGLGRPGTSVLVGPGDLGYGALSGGRLTIGGWLNRQGTLGLEAQGFLLETGSFRRSFASDATGNPVIGNPIIDSSGFVGGGENAIVASFPLTNKTDQIGFRGDQGVLSHSRLWGAEANAVLNSIRSNRYSLDFLVGFRYLNLAEDLSVLGNSTNLVPEADEGGVAFLNDFFDGTVTSNDTFTTRNQFYGGQLGVRVEVPFGRRFVNVAAKVALGSTHEIVEVRGFSTLQTTAGATAATVGGTYAVASNIGRRSRDEFSVVPEVNVKLGYHLTKRLRGFLGYDFLYWSDVARAGNQIDRRVDIRQVPTIGPIFDPTLRNVPPFPFLRGSDFWAQGLSFGLEFRY